MSVKYKRYWRKTGLKGSAANTFINQLILHKPKNFLEIGVFCGVTARNVCENLNIIHDGKFKYTGIDLFGEDQSIIDEIEPNYIKKQHFNNPLKKLYYNFILKENLNSLESVSKFLRKYKKNITLIKGNSNKILKEYKFQDVDFIFLDGGHSYETVVNDLSNLYSNLKAKNCIILCDDYDLPTAPGVKRAIDEFVHSNLLKLDIIHDRFAKIIT